MVVIGAEPNEIHYRRNPQVDEICVPAQGVVLLAFDQMMTRDVLKQLGNRAVHQTNAAVDVSRTRW